MNIDERFNKFPIKFYQTGKGVHYENSFLSGDAKDLNDALNQIRKKNLDWDLFYYYDDVSDIKIGAFEPALKDKETKQGLYLGKLNLELDLNGLETEGSVRYLSAHPEKIKDHDKLIKKIKDDKRRRKFFNDIKQKVKKVAGYFTEMFYPYKSREDLICEHCGEIIPVGTYYEEWKRKDYHIECIWDKLCNDQKYNTYENAKKYFFSLQEFLSDWPGNLDCQEDYESDLELVKGNERLNKI